MANLNWEHQTIFTAGNLDVMRGMDNDSRESI